MYVCIYVCMYICMYTCIHACMPGLKKFRNISEYETNTFIL